MKILDLISQPSGGAAGAENLHIFNEAGELATQSSGEEAAKMTPLKEVVSWGSALASLLSLSLTGEKFPIYQNSKANAFLDRAITKLQTENKVINTGKKIVHRLFKEVFSAAGIAVNTGLFLLNGSSIPLFKDSFIGGTATTIAKEAKTWWNKKAQKNSIFGKICKGLSSLHEAKNNFVTSKLTYNTLAFGLTVACLGAGPIGWGIGAGVMVADVAIGATRVKRIHDLEDELSYLRSLEQSKKSLNSLDLEKGNTKSMEQKDELNQSVVKASKVSLIHQAAPIALIATSAINPAAIGLSAAQSVLAMATTTANKLTEEQALQKIENEIIKLRNELKAGDMSKEELGRAALAYEMKATGRIEADLKKGNPLFSDSKLYPGIGSAIVNGFKYVGNYIHPFKKPTSYVKSFEKLEEKAAALRASSSDQSSSQSRGRSLSSGSLQPSLGFGTRSRSNSSTITI